MSKGRPDCDQCHGSGEIVLLTSIVPCEECRMVIFTAADLTSEEREWMDNLSPKP